MSADLDSLRAELREARALAFRQATELQSLREQLGDCRSATDRDIERRMEFVARVSHEVRSPLDAILGYVDLLLETSAEGVRPVVDSQPPLPPPSGPATAPARPHEAGSEFGGEGGRNPLQEPACEIRPEALAANGSWLRVIQRNARQLLGVVEDMVELTRLEAGRVSLETADTWPAREVFEVLQEKGPAARRKGLTLDMRYQGPIPERIRTDPRRFRQILANLVGNAIKYTDQGGVTVTLAMATSPWDEAPRLAVRIEDTGIGIGPEWRRHLFASPLNVPDDGPRHSAQTGLGLAVSWHLARLLGGGIEVDSEPGRGSRFTWTTGTGRLDQVRMIGEIAADPFEEEPRPAPVRRSTPPALDARVLVVEDGVDNQRLLRMILERAGAAVDIASNGRAGVDRALDAVQSGSPYDAILMDIQMPELDGYEATRELRERGVHQPIVALTAHAMVGDRDRCLAAGCDDYLTKPVDRELLLGTLNRWLDEARAEAGVA